MVLFTFLRVGRDAPYENSRLELSERALNTLGALGENSEINESSSYSCQKLSMLPGLSAGVLDTFDRALLTLLANLTGS